MDFDWFFYVAKVHLGYSKEEFMKSCPKEVSALWDMHVKFNDWKVKEDREFKDNRVYTIDEVPWL